MKKVYVQVKNGYPINVDIQNAIDGFEMLDYEPQPFTFEDVLSGKLNIKALHNPVVGSIDGIISLFNSINKKPEPIDFPESVINNTTLLNRELMVIRLDDFIHRFKMNEVPKFVKPIQTKLFDGVLISKINDLSYLRGYDNPLVYVSDELDIVSEHRAYIHNDIMIYCCCYRGDFKVNPDYSYINRLKNKYVNSPVAYTIDVAVLRDGRMACIEYNDFWAIGSYGLYSYEYAKMLLDRYNEIIGL